MTTWWIEGAHTTAPNPKTWVRPQHIDCVIELDDETSIATTVGGQTILIPMSLEGLTTLISEIDGDGEEIDPYNIRPMPGPGGDPWPSM